MTSLAPPQNAAPLDGRGQMSQPWTQFLARMGRELEAAKKGGAVPQSTLDSISAALQAGTDAQGAATAAQASADAVAALLAASPVQWVFGDARQTALTLGADWLLCDGSSAVTADYPDFAASLAQLTSAGSLGPTFVKPQVASVLAPNGSGIPVLQTWVLAR